MLLIDNTYIITNINQLINFLYLSTRIYFAAHKTQEKKCVHQDTTPMQLTRAQ